MRKELILFLSCSLVLTALISVVNAKDTNKVQSNANPVAFSFNDNPFFQSNDDVFNQIETMQQAMSRLMRSQFAQINGGQFDLMNSKRPLNSSQEIQMEERNNELIYKIKQPQGNDSKVDVSVKDGVLIINTQLMQKTSHSENGSKSYSYSQSNYNQSFKLPKGYDPNSIDIKSKDANLIVTFKKQSVSNSLKI
ncbi:Hsp20/alpha crystallin family protein [Legionella maioricensis]|uniref:Hsp20/alpha crystallin family protein n=1 Tax=Legionella maioricensis TaxID=2896528 RepID=A0A9X2ICA8_9GAMM|nr:Hsp20/alpha crystallin family protein [Legionella maioricensis]MCL9684217.1 Hsp20/alpha crystallin family protein [Legionella maioricensis]MCL9687083.1 Hsp20/alpha crystallin family protein [Legionella maioricensis]